MIFDADSIVALPANAGGVRVRIPDATSVDNIWTALDTQSGQKFRIQPAHLGEYDLSWLLSGTGDKTALIQNILTDTSIKKLIVSKPFTISGTLTIPNDVWVEYREGGRFVGVGNVNGGRIKAAYDQYIFGPNLTVNPVRTYLGCYSVMWHNADPTGVADSKDAIQRAIDVCVRNPTLPRDLKYPRGDYSISGPVIAHNWNGTDYQFFSLNMVGEWNGYFTSAAYDTTINLTSTDTFAIGYQRARSSEVRGLAITGPFNRSFGNYRNQFVASYSTFASAGGVRDNRQSPLSGILIDPFTNTPDSGEEYITAANKYPGLSSWYRGTGTRGGSSAVNVRDCRIYGFTVCVGYSVNGMTLNAENCRIENVAAEVCKAAFAYGQGQIKDNYIRNTIHWDRVHTIVDCNSYGSVSGLRPALPYIDGLNIAGGVNRIFYTNSNFNAGAQNIFAELLFEIGWLRNACPFTIKNSSFNFPPEGDTVVSPEYHIFGNNLLFENCDFKIYDDLFKQRIIVKGDNIEFKLCRFDRKPIEQYANLEKHTIIYKNCYTGDGYFLGFEHRNTPAGTLAVDSLKIKGKTTYTVKSGSQYIPWGSTMKIVNESDSGDAYYQPSAGYVATTKVGDELSVTFALGELWAFAVGDYVIEAENTLVSYFYEADGLKDTSPIYGRVKSINTGTGEVILTAVPKHITSQANAFMQVVKERFHGLPGTMTFDNTATASDVMFPQGMGIFSVGGSIVAVDPTNHTVTYNASVALTEKDYNQGDPDAQIIINSPETPFVGNAFDTFIYPIVRGTKWITAHDNNSGYGPKERVFICTKSGLLNPTAFGKPSGLQAQFAEAPTTRLVGSTLEYYDFSTETWTAVAAGGESNPATDTFTTGGDTSRVVAANRMVKILVKPSSPLTAFKVGTTNGGEEIFEEMPLDEDVWTVLSGEYFFESSGNIYFGGISSSTDIKIIKTAAV